MGRAVIGADGREWLIRSQLEWRAPVTAKDFEHDVSGGARPGYVMIGLVVLLVLILVIWRPEAVHVPTWFLLVMVLAALFFPTRWALRRPWTIVAETPGLEPPPRAQAARRRRALDDADEPEEPAEPPEPPAADREGGLQGAGPAGAGPEPPAQPAEPEPSNPHPAERWVGTVRGMFRVRNTISRTTRMIKKASVPDPTSPLRPVD